MDLHYDQFRTFNNYGTAQIHSEVNSDHEKALNYLHRCNTDLTKIRQATIQL